MRPRKRHNRTLPPNLYAHKKGRRYYFSYRHPQTGKITGMGIDRVAAEKAARELNAQLMKSHGSDLVARVLDRSDSMDAWLDRYLEIYLAREPAESSQRNRENQLKHIQQRFGRHRIGDIETRDIAEFIKGIVDQGKARAAQGYRSALSDIFRTAIEEGWIKHSPVSATRNPRVKVQRSRLKLEDFNAILEQAPARWISNAMLVAVVTGQRLEDIASMQFRDVSDGWLHVIQRKTGTPVRISTDLRLESIGLSVSDVISRCRDSVVSRYLIHHSKNSGKASAGTRVFKATISNGFARARHKTNLHWDFPPTFHEIRSLSGRLYKDQGLNPQSLFGHKDAKMTAIYTDARGAEWLEVKQK